MSRSVPSTTLCRLGAWALVGILALLPIQIAVFAVVGTPPDTARDAFALYDENRFLGLVTYDILLVVDTILFVLTWPALYLALRRAAPNLMLVAVLLGVVGAAMYLASNTSIELMLLSEDHAAATADADRQGLLQAGTSALAQLNGTAYTLGYLLSGAAALLTSIAMLRDPAFGRLAGGIGIGYAALQVVPPNLGTLGLWLSTISLLPMIAWFAVLAVKLRRLARSQPPAPASERVVAYGSA